MNLQLDPTPVGDVARRPGPGAITSRPSAVSPTLSWTPTSLSGGAVLYREGSACEKLFKVQRGIVKAVAHLPNGRVRILGLHGPGAVLGLVTPAAKSTSYGHSAIALTRVELRWAPAGQVRHLRRHNAEEYLDLVERHCEELTDAKRWITEFSADTTTRRIARAIRFLAELQDSPDSGLVELLTCQEMAEMIGVSTESASRVLAKFKRSGLLRPSEAPGNGRYYRFDANAVDAIAMA